MLLGAALRRFSSRWIRVTGLVSTTVLMCTVAGSFGVMAAAAPYPPTTPPCALSWSPHAAGSPVLVGSGYDVNQPVKVTLYPQATTLGSYATNASGAFQTPLDVAPGPRADAVWVTATSPHRSCSVAPPSGGGTRTRPTSTPTTGGTTTPPGSAPTTSGGGGSSDGSGGSNGSNGSGGSNGNAGSGSGSGSGATSSPYPPSGASSTQTSGTPGSGTPSTPGTSTTPARPTTTSPSPSSNADAVTRPLGVPLSVIVTIALLLLLAGGLGVLVLTRRSS